MPLTAPVRSTSAPPAAPAVPSASVSSSPPVIGPGAFATTASADETMPLLIHGLPSFGDCAPKIQTLSPGVAGLLGHGHRPQRALGVEQDEPGRVVATDDRCGQGLAGGRGDLGGLGVADDRGAGQDVAAVPHADAGGLAGAARVVHGDEHDPRRDRSGELGQRRVALGDTLLRPLRRLRVVRALTVERADDAEHHDGRDRAERTGGERREERARPGSVAERRRRPR